MGLMAKGRLPKCSNFIVLITIFAQTSPLIGNTDEQLNEHLTYFICITAIFYNSSSRAEFLAT